MTDTKPHPLVVALHVLLAYGLLTATTLLWFMAMVFSNSEADQIPDGAVQQVVWFALSGVAWLAALGAAVQVVRPRLRSCRRLSLVAIAFAGGFWTYAGALTG